MSAPVLTPPAQRLVDWAAPWLEEDAENDYAFTWVLSVVGDMFNDVEQVVRTDPDTGAPGWARLFDPDNAPAFALPYTAQAAGQPYDPNADADTQRPTLHPDANKRGTPGTIKAAVGKVLTGTKRVVLVERVTTAYRHTVVTFTDETPDPDAVVAILANPLIKPVGHWFTHEVADGWLIDDMETAYTGQTIGDLEGDYSTISDLEANTP